MCVELPCGYSSQTLTTIIAYCKIVVYVCLIVVAALFGLLLERNPETPWKDVAPDTIDFNQTSFEPPFGSVNTDNKDIKYDLTQLLELANPFQACFITWLVLSFISGLIFSIVLLQGAQERNLIKVKVWFFVTIISYLVWIPFYAYLLCHAVEPVNILMSGFMTYMLGGLCLWVVSGFIEELRIESISHRVGYKDVPFYKI